MALWISLVKSLNCTKVSGAHEQLLLQLHYLAAGVGASHQVCKCEVPQSLEIRHILQVSYVRVYCYNCRRQNFAPKLNRRESRLKRFELLYFDPCPPLLTTTCLPRHFGFGLYLRKWRQQRVERLLRVERQNVPIHF